MRYTYPLQRDLFVPPELTDSALDLDNRTNIDTLEVDFVAFVCGVCMLIVPGFPAAIQGNGTMAIDGSVDGRHIVGYFFTAEEIDGRTAAVIQGHRRAVRVDVEGDDDADETDPAYGMI